MTARSAAFARFFALLFVLSSSVAFVSHPTRWVEQSYAQRTNVHQALSMARIEVGYIGEIPNGERKIVDTSSGAVIVTNVDNKLYAVNAKCPHLGLPMKRGPVTSDADGPCITCNFHRSKFSLEDGSCKKWSESVFGIPGTNFVGGLIGSVGGAPNSPATVYSVTTEEGKIFLDI